MQFSSEVFKKKKAREEQSVQKQDLKVEKEQDREGKYLTKVNGTTSSSSAIIRQIKWRRRKKDPFFFCVFLVWSKATEEQSVVHHCISIQTIIAVLSFFIRFLVSFLLCVCVFCRLWYLHTSNKQTKKNTRVSKVLWLKMTTAKTEKREDRKSVV